MSRQRAHTYRPTESNRPTESKYKGGADEKYITYDLEQKTRGGGSVPYPKVKRIYIAGKVKDWKVGSFKKKSGRKVYGVQITYQQTRESYGREKYSARRGEVTYQVKQLKLSRRS